MSSWAVRGYTEGRELGRGASGRVVEATSEATGQRVAIKYLSASLVGDPEYMARFREEARLLTELEVPQVVRLLAYVEKPGAGAAIVMELVDGVSLHELISGQGATGPESALAVLKGSLLGLAAAHSLGIVHRDYKPENVLVDATGASKLADFGVAVRTGRRVPAAGTPLYMAPEQWAGGPASPATDIYAATAVFYECLTGRTPFSGRLRQLRRQHERAAVPSADVDEPLRPLVERGMAKDPATRPVNAATFVAELEATATAAYGPDWERRGRGQLAARAAALLLLLLGRPPIAASAPDTDAVTWFLRRKDWFPRRKKAVLAVIAAVVAGAAAIAGTAIASQGRPTSQVVTLAKQAVLTASATTTPPAAAGSCKTPTAFTNSATLTAGRPGLVTYRWVYSSGTKNGRPRMGPLQTVRFAAAGSRLVSGGVIRTRTAGAGWAKIEVTSPVRVTSNTVRYLLICIHGHQSGNVSATAVAAPAAATVTCGTPPPSFAFTGTVTSSKAGPVTYYWALGDGATTAPGTLLFKAPGRMNVQQLAFTPPTEGTGTAVIVVTSPAKAVSNAATFTLSCNRASHPHGGGTLSLSASAHVSPASSNSGCTFGPSTFTFTGSITANQATTVTYYWALNSGDGPAQTLTFAGAGTEAVAADTFTPPSPNAYTGAGQIVIVNPTTSPATGPSNRVTFTQSCTNVSLHVSTTSLPAALQDEQYSATLNAEGGKAPYTWSASGLPPDLSINPVTGVISGVPTTAGTYTVTVTVTDSETATAQKATARKATAQTESASTLAAKTASASLTLTLTVKPPAYSTLQVTTTSLPAGTQGVAYTPFTVQAAGGKEDYTWTPGALADGLSINASGVISGTPKQGGDFNVTVTVTDSETPAQKKSVTLPLTVTYQNVSITTTQVDLDNNGFDNLCQSDDKRSCPQYAMAATGGSGSYTWSASGLPPGVSITAAGQLTDVPPLPGTGVGCSYAVQITVTDNADRENTRNQTYHIGSEGECTS